MLDFFLWHLHQWDTKFLLYCNFMRKGKRTFLKIRKQLHWRGKKTHSDWVWITSKKTLVWQKMRKNKSFLLTWSAEINYCLSLLRLWLIPNTVTLDSLSLSKCNEFAPFFNWKHDSGHKLLHVEQWNKGSCSRCAENELATLYSQQSRNSGGHNGAF